MGNTRSPCPETSSGESSLPCQGHIQQLVSCKTVQVVPPQHEIFSQEDTPHSAYLICSGLVKLTRTESSGQRVIIGLRRAGWLLGAVTVLSEMPYICTAETVIRSRLCFVPKDQLKQAMQTNASFSLWISMMFSRGYYSSVLNIKDRSCLSGRQRLEKFLREVVNLDGRNAEKAVKLPILLKQWEVAQLLGLTPQHLSRLVKQMENEGLVARKKGWLILPEPKRLWHPDTASAFIPA